jgi:VanZ family protein
MRKFLYNSITVVILLAIVYLSLTSRSIVNLNVTNIDKVQHGLAYAVLSFFFCMSLRSWGINKSQFVVTLLFCALIGGILEIIQSRYGRMMELGDFTADMAGASLSCFIIFLMDHRAA